MAVDAGEFHRALESVCDIFKLPSLYSEQEKCLEALLKGKDVYGTFQITVIKHVVVMVNNFLNS